MLRRGFEPTKWDKWMATKTKQHMHLTMDFGEHDEDGYSRCNACGNKTVLISSPCCNWSVDSEPFKAGEEATGDVPDDVEVSEEVTAHFCLTCDCITSLSFNS